MNFLTVNKIILNYFKYFNLYWRKIQMNKKEVSEIKHNFTEDNGFMTISKILTTFIDAENEVKYNEVHNFLPMTAEDREVYMTTLKNVLSTSVGKKFTEYKFEDDAYGETGIQSILYNLIQTEFGDTDVIDSYVNHMRENIEYTGPYNVITSYCIYSVPHKSSTGDLEDYDNEQIFKFILTAICPADTSKDGFIYDKEHEEVVKKVNNELIISMKPTDGFMFPTFSDRMADVNSVMIYTKSTKDVNVSICTDFLNCTYRIGAETEKTVFDAVLTNILSDDLNYNVINHINESIKQTISRNSNDTEIPTITSYDLKHVLKDTGVEDTKLDRIEGVWNSICGVPELTASNLITPVHKLNAEGVSVTVKGNYADKVHTSTMNGRKCIVIDVDEPVIEINGMSVKLQ